MAGQASISSGSGYSRQRERISEKVEDPTWGTPYLDASLALTSASLSVTAFAGDVVVRFVRDTNKDAAHQSWRRG